MSSLNSLLSIGQTGLSASQSSIQVTGNNIANVNTEGYCRQTVVLKDGVYINGAPGQMGSGVVAQEVVRAFDAFVEAHYIGTATDRDRWASISTNLANVETLFNESTNSGISDKLASFFNDWQSLTTNPSDYSQRQTLLDDSQNLLTLFNETDSNLAQMQYQSDQVISQDVDQVNQLAQDIATLNRQISENLVPGVNNPNGLYDTRNQKIRQLASLLDVNVVDRGGGELAVFTKAGQTIVDGMTTFSFKFEPGKTVDNLGSTSTFNGQVYYDGTDSNEYTLKVVQGGQASNGSAAATFQVSLDGGRTWMKDDSGNVQTFSARLSDGKVRVGNLDIWFGAASNSGMPPVDANLTAGDTFTLVPKKGLYWYRTTGSPVNVTPQTYQNGQDNTSRVTGGALGGLFTFRDQDVGRYRQRLNSLTESLVWEVNRVHSQGAGLDQFATTTGTYAVQGDDIALGSNSSGLAFADRLQSGASMFYVYNQSTGALVSNAMINFDPKTMSLEDVRTAISNACGTYLNVSISNHQLVITGKPGYSFAFGADSSGLFAALGLNTFFTGSTPHDIAVNSTLTTNSDYLNAGHVNGAGESNPGDNTTALAMAALQNTAVAIKSPTEGTATQTLSSYYDSLVGVVGTDTENAKFQYNFQQTLAAQIDQQQQAISGVNLDEEMSNLIKFQHSYQAAAKLISTADQLMQTVLALKN